VIIVNAHAFLAGFAGAQLADRVEDAAKNYMCERIAVAAVAIAEWESGGGQWDGGTHHFDFVCDEVGKLISAIRRSDEEHLEVLYQQVKELVSKGVQGGLI
jgi:hypothetical protein